ncbi:MAG TPA: LON peptidase substrate-binding domain-containing protein, partial [Bacillota bacterium]|nr:LON peptidase substrate-binding domain-containing protein [Bacillota bacterium]
MTSEQLKTMPLLPLRGLLVFPSVVLHLDVGREKSIASIEKAMVEEKIIMLAAQKKVSVSDPKEDDIYHIGTIAKINQMLKLPNGTIRVLVEGLGRGEIVQYIHNDTDGITVDVKELDEIRGKSNEEEALMRSLLQQFEQYINVSHKITRETLESVSDIDDPGRFADIITYHLALKLKNKQLLLETLSVIDRMKHLIKAVSNEKKVLDLEQKIGKRVKTSMERTQKEY